MQTNMGQPFATPRVLYQHRQIGWATLLFICIPALGVTTFLMMSSGRGQQLPPFIPVAICLVTAFVFVSFTSLSVFVTRDYVVARFGIGVVRKTVALADIATVEVTRTRWYEGWGIHWTRRGMLYNVAGFDGALIRLVNGRSLVIGSDDAPRLVSAIRRAIDERRVHSF